MSKQVKPPIYTHGWDISLNHGAIVSLKNGKLHNVQIITSNAAVAKLHKKNAIKLTIPAKLKKPEYRDLMAIWRLDWWYRFLQLNIIPGSESSGLFEYHGVESYALNKNRGAHQIGEVGGLIRLALWNNGSRFRLHDPMTVKMFMTGDGHADKEQMADVVKSRFDINFSNYNPPAKVDKKTGKVSKQNTDTSEDLTDAFAVAYIVYIEAMLRLGYMQMFDLSEKEIQAFNRITSFHPVNILGSEWLQQV